MKNYCYADWTDGYSHDFSAEDYRSTLKEIGERDCCLWHQAGTFAVWKKVGEDFKQPKVFASDSGNSTLQTARFGAELGYRHPASFINCFIFYHQLSFDPCPTVPKEYHFLLSNCCKKVTFP